MNRSTIKKKKRLPAALKEASVSRKERKKNQTNPDMSQPVSTLTHRHTHRGAALICSDL